MTMLNVSSDLVDEDVRHDNSQNLKNNSTGNTLSDIRLNGGIVV